jgi:hypothetical protein
LIIVLISLQSLDIKVQNKATIITAPPRFASGTHCQTTLYELIEDIYERQRRGQPGYDVGDVEFYRHIYPLFQRMYQMSWTNKKALQGHGMFTYASRVIFELDKNLIWQDQSRLTTSLIIPIFSTPMLARKLERNARKFSTGFELLS